jgi:phage terminase large subunit
MRLDQLRTMDDATYRHVWLGEYLKRSDAQIFANKYRIKDFKVGISWDGPYCGVDFGFAQDPTGAVMCWVNENVLYIEYEAGKIGLELDDTADFINSRMPRFEEYTSRADSARPESISYLKRHGMPKIKGVKKGPGSVEDGVEFIKSFDNIYIHSRCVETAKEFSNYSYKTDRLSGDVLPVIRDDWNHYIDSLRYALQPLIANKGKLQPMQISFVN